jgi:hypothetical protein
VISAFKNIDKEFHARRLLETYHLVGNGLGVFVDLLFPVEDSEEWSDEELPDLDSNLRHLRSKQD